MSYKSADEVKIQYTKLFINGQFVDSVSGKKMDVVSPATSKKIGEVSEGFKEDVDLAVKAARDAFPKWRDLNPHERGKILWRWGDLIEKNADYMSALEAVDNGKPYPMCASVDTPLSIEQFRYYGGFADKLSETLPTGGDFVAYVQKEPYGVCGQIIPWNFPLLMFAWKVCPALACGNTVVIKSSEHTPLTALYAAALGKEAGLPDGVLNVLSGFGPTCGEFIARHPDVNKISFTGSTAVGKLMMVCSGESNIKNVSLELGGKSPLIVYPDMKDKLEWAVGTCCSGVFFNQGQVCCASSRIFVHEEIYEDFLKVAKEISEKRVVGDPFKPGVEQGAQNSKKQYDKILHYLDLGPKEGAKVLTGGKSIGDGSDGWFIQPTIFVDCKDDMKIVKEEIFGPVICVLPFKTTEEVIKRANDTAYGLAAGVLTHDLTTSMRVARGVKAGTIWVNCWNIFGANLPFGGYKQSGFGKDSGIHAVRNYTKEKVVIISAPGLKLK